MIGLGVRGAGLLLVGVLLGGLAGCSAPGAAASLAAPTGTPPAPTAGLPSGFTSLVCRDPGPAAEPVDLIEVSLGRPAGSPAPAVTVRFRLSRPPQLRAGVLELAVGLYDRAGAPRESLAVRFRNGRAQLLTYSPASGTVHLLPGPAVVTGGAVSATFPVDPARQAGGAWQWRAVAAVDGSTVDSCPAG